MKNSLNLKLNDFIRREALSGKKLLIAVSTGLDSMVLLHQLLKLKNLTLAIVHVHHGWRKESDAEYAFLEDFALKRGLLFFGKQLKPEWNVSDKENRARLARYSFFQQVYEEWGAEGLFLAHHKNDLDETVIKRVLEGAHLSHLGGMKEVSLSYGMQLYRPFLSLSKEELKKTADQEQITYFEDHTNTDPQFLRTRLRSEFFPLIERILGKKLNDNLRHLSLQAWQMQAYFERLYTQKVSVITPAAELVVLQIPLELDLFELTQLMLVFFKERNLSLPRKMLEDLVRALSLSREPKEFKLRDYKLIVSKGFCVLLLKEELDAKVSVEASCRKSFPGWFCRAFLTP